MNFLAVNDDGIFAEGIHLMVKTLSKYGKVYVTAPAMQQSAASQKLSVHEKVYVEERSFENAELAFAIGGTPADCVKLGIAMLEARGIHIDAVFSGINHGRNTGRDVYYSGTLGAAREGVFCGKPSIALSLGSHHPLHFDYILKLTELAVTKMLPRITSHTLISINAPNIPEDEVEGIRLCRIGPRDYDFVFKPQYEEDGRLFYSYDVKESIYTDMAEDMDSVLAQHHYATITPLAWDCTDYKLIDEMKSWELI